MRNAFLLSSFFLALGLTSCSSDDPAAPTSDSLTVNGAAFMTANNSGATQYNVIKSENGTSLWLEVFEKGGSGRRISGSLVHPQGPASGTYILKNDQLAIGIAVIALLDDAGQQLAGGSESQPTGTFSLTDNGNHRFALTFNDVVLDPGTASETHISGSCSRTFAAE
jgi:hypothetical protein